MYPQRLKWEVWAARAAKSTNERQLKNRAVKFITKGKEGGVIPSYGEGRLDQDSTAQFEIQGLNN